jgi:hypothetical protein
LTVRRRRLNILQRRPIRADACCVGLLDEVGSGLFVAAASNGRRRRLARTRATYARQFVRIVDSPWPKVAAAGMTLVAASAGALLLAGVGVLVSALTDDTLGLGFLVLLGPVLLGGALAVLPAIAGMLGVAHRAWNLDGSSRIELGFLAVAALMVLSMPILATGWWPLLVPTLAAFGVLGIVVWPAPWRQPPAIPLLYSE